LAHHRAPPWATRRRCPPAVAAAARV